MNVTGEYAVPAPPSVVWEAMHDPEVLRHAVPGCEELTQTGPGAFAGTAKIGIAVIKGLYRGTVTLDEEDPPRSLCIAVDAKSSHARINGEGTLTLTEQPGGTLLRYEGSVRIHGLIAAVGQRLIPSASKSLTQEFFRNLERYLAARKV